MKKVILLFLIITPYLTMSQNKLIIKEHKYDDKYQLIKTIYSSGKTYTYIYDSLGNRTQKIISTSCVLPTAFLSGSTTIENGQSTNLKMDFAGTKPISVTLNSLTFNGITGNSQTHQVNPGTTQTYSISQLSNACGFGTAHGSATVTVVPRVLRPDIVIESFTINQYTEKEIYFTIQIKNIGELPAEMSNFNLKSFVSPNSSLQQVGGFNNSWNMDAMPQLAVGEIVTLLLRTNIDYKSNLHYYIFLPDFYNFIEESNETNNQKSYLVKKCNNPNSDTLQLTGNLDLPIYFGKTRIEIKDATITRPNLFIIAPQINGFPNFSVGQNNVTFLTGTCVNPEPGYIPGNGFSFVESLKILKSTTENTFKIQTKNKEVLSLSLWDGKTKLGDLAKNEEFEKGILEFGLEKYKLSAGKSYTIVVEGSSGKNLIEYITK